MQIQSFPVEVVAAGRKIPVCGACLSSDGGTTVQTVHDTVSVDANISRLLVTSLPRVVVILRLHVE